MSVRSVAVRVLLLLLLLSCIESLDLLLLLPLEGASSCGSVCMPPSRTNLKLTCRANFPVSSTLNRLLFAPTGSSALSGAGGALSSYADTAAVFMALPMSAAIWSVSLEHLPPPLLLLWRTLAEPDCLC
jgi:hypothetical protein